MHRELDRYIRRKESEAKQRPGVEGKYGHVHTICNACTRSMLIITRDVEMCCRCGCVIEAGMPRTWAGDIAPDAVCTLEAYAKLLKERLQ